MSESWDDRTVLGVDESHKGTGDEEKHQSLLRHLMSFQERVVCCEGQESWGGRCCRAGGWRREQRETMRVRKGRVSWVRRAASVALPWQRVAGPSGARQGKIIVAKVKGRVRTLNGSCRGE